MEVNDELTSSVSPGKCVVAESAAGKKAAMEGSYVGKIQNESEVTEEKMKNKMKIMQGKRQSGRKIMQKNVE